MKTRAKVSRIQSLTCENCFRKMHMSYAEYLRRNALYNVAACDFCLRFDPGVKRKDGR